MQEGYPPRPDPANAPQQYAAWVKHVSHPVSVYQPVPVTALGLQFGVGTYQGNNTQGPWDSIVQDEQGFDSSHFPLPGTLYDVYYADTLIPYNLGCDTGSSCVTGIWAGMGGMPTDVNGTLTAGGTLIQSGLSLASGSNLPVPSGTWLFTSYVYGFGAETYYTGPPPGDISNVGDEIGVWGWSSASSSCAAGDTTGNWGCYAFEDYTQGWTIDPAPFQNPGVQYLPSQVEYAAECPIQNKSTGQTYHNSFYYETAMEGLAEDSTGLLHGDPGNAGGNGNGGNADDYIETTGKTLTGDRLTRVVWGSANGNNPPTPAADPMVFVWQNFN